MAQSERRLIVKEENYLVVEFDYVPSRSLFDVNDNYEYLVVRYDFKLLSLLFYLSLSVISST